MLTDLYVSNNTFLAWNTEHLAWLSYAILSTLFWIGWGRKAHTQSKKQQIGLLMMLVGFSAWLYAQGWMFGTDQAPYQSVVPLHLCYFFNLLLPLMVWRKWYPVFDVVYPIVMAGCLQALLTPDLTEGFPHYTNLRYWMVHIALVQSVLYCIFVYNFRPTWKSIFKCILFMNLYALFVCPFNFWLDTNFLYLRRPAPGSMLESMGEWPWYLINAEWLMLVLFTIVCLPFLFKNRKG